MPSETTIFEWQAPDHIYRPKTVRWYIVFAAVCTAIVCLFITVANFTAAVAVAILSAMVYYVVQKKPRAVRYRILGSGIAVDNLLYPYPELESFNIVYQPGEVKSAIIRTKRRLSPFLHLEIGDADPVEVRDVLLEYVPEDQNLEEPLVDILARRLGF